MLRTSSSCGRLQDGGVVKAQDAFRDLQAIGFPRLALGSLTEGPASTERHVGGVGDVGSWSGLLHEEGGASFFLEQ